MYVYSKSLNRSFTIYKQLNGFNNKDSLTLEEQAAVAEYEQHGPDLVQEEQGREVHGHDGGEGGGDEEWAGHAHEECLAGERACVRSH